MVMTSKSRLANWWEMETRPGNSWTHGAHQVAQTLMSLNFWVGLRTRAATFVAAMDSKTTGAPYIFSSTWINWALFSIHLVEQPNGLVTAVVTGFPASISSTALRASVACTVLVPAKRESSKRPM